MTESRKRFMIQASNQIKANEKFVVRSIHRIRGLLRITTIKYKKIKKNNLKFAIKRTSHKSTDESSTVF